MKKRVNYDIRNDCIPYEDGSVDNIYVSHVIEHIETIFVKRMIAEAYRVLKPGGVLRLVCPDGKFLFEVSQFQNEYWTWRHKSFSDQKLYDTDWANIDQYDFLVRETCSQKCRYYKNKGNEKIDINLLKPLTYDQYKNKVTKGAHFRSNFPGDHINVWEFDSLKEIGEHIGFRHIIQSKKWGSVSAVMQRTIFDKTAPQTSLYVEMIK